MAPLIIILTVFLILHFLSKRYPSLKDYLKAWPLGIMFISTGIGHFTLPGMVKMVPAFFKSFRSPIIEYSGYFELGLGIFLLLRPKWRLLGAVAVMLLIGFLPVNIWAAFQKISFGSYSYGPVYLFFRVPVQFVLSILQLE